MLTIDAPPLPTSPFVWRSQPRPRRIALQTVGGGGSGSGDNGAAASTSSANSVVVTVDKEKRSPGSSSPGQRKEIGRQEDSQSGQGSDRLLGECTLDLVSVVSGRVLHMEEWVPLSSGGDLKLSLDYDSVGTLPSPGDSASGVSMLTYYSVLGILVHRGCAHLIKLTLYQTPLLGCVL